MPTASSVFLLTVELTKLMGTATVAKVCIVNLKMLWARATPSQSQESAIAAHA